MRVMVKTSWRQHALRREGRKSYTGKKTGLRKLRLITSRQVDSCGNDRVSRVKPALFKVVDSSVIPSPYSKVRHPSAISCEEHSPSYYGTFRNSILTVRRGLRPTAILGDNAAEPRRQCVILFRKGPATQFS